AATAAAPSFIRAVAVTLITVMNSAVPAAPANCWTVLKIALPCEYRSGGTDPSDDDISGVITDASPSMSRQWMPTTIGRDDPVSSSVISHSDAATTTEPGITRGRAPIRSKSRPTIGDNRP